MRFLKNTISILALAVLLGLASWGVQTLFAPARTFSGETEIQNLSNLDSGEQFAKGDTVLVKFFLKNDEASKNTLIALEKKYNNQFGFKEGSLKIDGKPMDVQQLKLPAGGDPVMVTYEAVALSDQGDPRSLLDVKTTIEDTQAAPLPTGTATISGCPSAPIVHNSDTMLVLQGSNMASTASITIDTLTLVPNKLMGETAWFNLPGKSLSDGNHSITLKGQDGSTVTTNCTITTQVYTSPVAINLTPGDFATGQARRILAQGEVLGSTRSVELRGPVTVSVPFEILDNKVLSFTTPATLPAGSYTLWLADSQGSTASLVSPLLVRDTN